MRQQRKSEYFSNTEIVIPKQSAFCDYSRFYKQERDWTCSIACIRTILSKFRFKVPQEDFYIQTYNLVPGPHYSKDIKSIGVLDEYKTVYGCDFEDNQKDLNTIIELLDAGYGVMMESMLNYAHWVVILGYIIIDANKDIEKHKVIVYDPYYNDVRILIADEFFAMWVDGDHEKTGVSKDFIAIK